jgi:hypothetical protein
VIAEKKTKGTRSAGPNVEGGSQEARKVAAAILEVLAGGVTPTDAAGALGVSVARYYQLESRALEGLVTGCEPRAKGPGRSPDRALAALTREHDRTKRELARSQALTRAAQRAVGLSLLHAQKKVDGKPGKRRRKPVVRAFRAAERLKVPGPQPEAVAGARVENLAGALAASG